VNFKIIPNPDKEIYDTITKAVKDNDGYCPCKIKKTPDTKCMCKEFREQLSGECHCGRFIKTKLD